MSALVARAVMTLAARCMGDHRRDWARAMAAECEFAAADGRALSFAGGCLIAAWRAMPGDRQGRFTLASHALAVGVMVPVAAALLFVAVFGVMDATSINAANRPAMPAVTVLILALSTGQLRLAWLLLERDWERLVQTAMQVAAATLTLASFAAVLFLGDARAWWPVAFVAIELAAVVALARSPASGAAEPAVS